jgi:UDP-N-acetylmuramate dehydrogenase
MAAEKHTEPAGDLRLNEPMSAHTSWRVGGPARRWYRPADLEDLRTFLRTLPAGEPIFWVGLGSNLLVRDGGFDGTVIMPFGGLDTLELLPGDRVRAGAGVTCAKVARFAARAGLVGAEFLAGIPGTMGGALAMNAGAFGGETWTLVASVDLLTREGELLRRTPIDFQIGYRSVQGQGDAWFVEVDLQLARGDTAAGQSRIRELLERRAAAQPVSRPSCGSVFKNPPNDHAARLIEASGLKGERVGRAEVSHKHANFIVNLGGARAGDIEALIERVRQQVLEKQGVALVTEVRIVGKPEAGDQ